MVGKLPGDQRHCDRKSPHVAASHEEFACCALFAASASIVKADNRRNRQHSRKYQVIWPSKPLNKSCCIPNFSHLQSPKNTK